MAAVLICALAFCGITMVGGSVWFWGNTNTYVGMAGGLAVLGWVGLWNAGGSIRFVGSLLMLTAVACTGWIFVFEIVAGRDAIVVWLFSLLIVLASAFVWIRAKLLAWWV